MSGLLQSIFTFLNRDFTGRTWERRQKHSYFGSLVYFGSKEPSRCYWEAELTCPGVSKSIGITMQGTSEGPTLSEEIFSRMTLSNLDALFEKCGPAFQPVFEEWAKQPFPSDWRQSFVLDGFSVPANGDESSPWKVCYFVEPVGQYFTAQFEGGKVRNVRVDG